MPTRAFCSARLRVWNSSARLKAGALDAAPPPPPQTRKKLSYKDQRDYDLLPGRIEEIEKDMAGIETEHQGAINMNVLDTLGLITTSFGLWMGVDGGDSVERHNPGDWKYLNLQFEDDRLVGASTAGMTDHVGVIRGLIQNRTRLGKWKDRLLKDPTRLMEAWVGITENVAVG